MAKRRRVKKNVATKVDTANKVKSSEQSALEKGVKKFTSCVESPQPSGAKKQKLDTRTECSPQAEKYVPPFTASQQVVRKARDKLQLNKTKMNSQENSSTEEEKESQNGDIESNAENKISADNLNGEKKEVKIAASTCLGDIKDKAMSEVEIGKDEESILKSNEECLGNSKVSEISDKHLLESDQIIISKELSNDAKISNSKSQKEEGKQVNNSICVVKVPKLSFIIKKYYVDIEQDQELRMEPIAQMVSSNPLNSGSPREMEKGNEEEKEKENEQEEEKENEQEKEEEKENEQEEEKENENEQEEKEEENEQEKEEEKENEQEKEKENEQEQEEEKEEEKEREGEGEEEEEEEEEKDDTKGLGNTKYEGYESKSLDMVDNQIPSQPSEIVQSNLPRCPQNDCKNQDIKIPPAETGDVQKENGKKAITENISTDTAKNDEDEENYNYNQPNISLTSDDLANQQTDQRVPTDIVLEKCQESEPADEHKVFGTDEKDIPSSYLNDNNCEKTRENNTGAMISGADSSVDIRLSFAKEFEVLEELLPKDDMGLFDDVMDDQLKPTRDETQIPEGDSTMQFLTDELSSLNCMVMNYQKAVDEMKRHYKLSSRF